VLIVYRLLGCILFCSIFRNYNIVIALAFLHKFHVFSDLLSLLRLFIIIFTKDTNNLTTLLVLRRLYYERVGGKNILVDNWAFTTHIAMLLDILIDSLDNSWQSFARVTGHCCVSGSLFYLIQILNRFQHYLEATLSDFCLGLRVYFASLVSLLYAKWGSNLWWACSHFII
jgi:hypothetical protein